jgi:predicted nucleotidyltransferase
MQKAQKELSELEEIAESERKDLLAERSRSVARIDELEDSNLELAVVNEDLKAERGHLLEVIADLENGLKEASRIPKSVGRINPDQILESVYPRLQFDDDFMENLNTYFRDWRPVMLDLWRLHNQDPALRQRAIKGLSVGDKVRVMEVRDHVPTGDPDAGDLGRLYWAKLPDGRLLVALHRKRDNDEQVRYLERFAQRCLVVARQTA